MTLSQLQTPVPPEGQRLPTPLRWDKDLVFKCQSQVLPGQVWHNSRGSRGARHFEVCVASRVKAHLGTVPQARQFWSTSASVLAQALPAMRECAPENEPQPRPMLNTRRPCRQCLCPALPPQKPPWCTTSWETQGWKKCVTPPVLPTQCVALDFVPGVSPISSPPAVSASTSYLA